MSLNDPQWGKRGSGGGNGGPPDLDEIWRNVNRRLSELFGRKSGGDEPGGDGGGARKGLPLGGVVLLVSLVVIVSRPKRVGRETPCSYRVQAAGEVESLAASETRPCLVLAVTPARSNSMRASRVGVLTREAWLCG